MKFANEVVLFTAAYSKAKDLIILTGLKILLEAYDSDLASRPIPVNKNLRLFLDSDQDTLTDSESQGPNFRNRTSKFRNMGVRSQSPSNNILQTAARIGNGAKRVVKMNKGTVNRIC